METEEHGQGSFKLLRSFLGTIAGGISSLASLPFGKRKKPDSPLPADPGPSSRTGLEDLSAEELSKLYPDIELSETRKRARLCWDEVFDDMVGFNNGKDKKGFARMNLPENIEAGVGDTSLGFKQAFIPLDDVQNAADEILENIVATADGVSYATIGRTDAQYIPNVSSAVSVRGHDVEPMDEGEDLDEYVAHLQKKFKARKAKEQDQVHISWNEDSPRKKVRFGDSAIGGSHPYGSVPEQEGVVGLNKDSKNAKRKRVDGTDDNDAKRHMGLDRFGELGAMKGRTSTVVTSGVLTRKRRREDDHFTRNVAELQENKPKRVGDTEKLMSEGVGSSHKDENFGKAPVFHDVKSGAPLGSSDVRARKQLVAAPAEETWGVFVSNTPTDVKDEELVDLFTASGSLKLEVSTVRVLRDPHSGLSKGTAYVFFKTEADVNNLLSSKRSYKLRGRVLRLYRAMATEQKSKQLQPVKHRVIADIKDSNPTRDHVKSSSGNRSETAAKEISQEVEHMLTRSKRSNVESGKEKLDVDLTSSHVVATKQKNKQSQPAKHLEDSLTKDSSSPLKRPKLSPFDGHETASKELAQEVAQMVTRGRRHGGESSKEQIGVVITSSHVHTTRRVATDSGPPVKIEESPEAKRKRLEKHQRGISRSKKIRRT